MKGHDDKEPDRSSAWYVGEGQRAQQLLDQGRVRQATAAFEAILERLGDAPAYGRAVMLGRLGRCAQVGGRPDLAAQRVREALDVLGTLAPSDGVKSLRGTLRSDLGDALRASGQYDAARKAYETALKIGEELNDLRGQGVDLGRMAALALTEGKLEEALTRGQAALRIFQRLHEPEMEAAAWHQLGRVYCEMRQTGEAERHYLEAARISEKRERPAAAAHTWIQLAVVAEQAGNSAAAEQWCLKAVAVAQHLDPASPDIWQPYGILATIIDERARAAADDDQRTALEMQARDYRELQRQAPRVSATLLRIGDSPSNGRAVILGQLGRCWHMGGRPDLAVACVRGAIEVTETLDPTDEMQSLRAALLSDLGDMLRVVGHDADASEAHEAALKTAEELQDVRGQAHASQRLGRIYREPRPRNEGSPFEVTLYDDLTTHYAFETDLLVDGPCERRIVTWTGEADAPSGGVRPVLLPCARTWIEDDGAIRFGLPQGEPIVERHPDCTIMRRIRREVAVSGASRVLSQLVSEMDGARTVAELLSGFPASAREVAERMLSALTATGVIDVSGRPVGRFLHLTTKKGVLPAGGLEGDEVLRLATDESYREYPGAPRIAVSEAVPARLRAFHALTRSRRSQRDYRSLPLARGDFDSLLHTACGVTGVLPWAGRHVKLRAYPSSGALYAVEIYPVVLRVEGLEPAVYHYRASENVLEVARPALDSARLVGAALPVERAMVSGAAALFCLTGCFPRHEQKYGEGGYRMLVAEAGHISQNLILAATALGVSARPFGGVFDQLLNQDLGLDGPDEQFLLAVVVGHA